MAASSSTTSFVLVESLNASQASPSSESYGRVVRFDKECVLIPEHSPHKGRRVVTRSYSLPLWKRRNTAAASDSESTDDPPSTSTTAPLFSSSPEETHVVLRVPFPSFVRRPSRSPGPSRGPSTRAQCTSPRIPLSPCLVQRALPSPSTETRNPAFPLSPIRRASQPIYQRRPDDLTVPLRACCPDCVPITDQCLKEGSTWKEKFTKGARRRRSASLDSTSGTGGGIVPKTAFTPGAFDARMPPPTFAITVDEVDKRRRSQDSVSAGAGVGGDNGEGTRSGSPFNRSTAFSKHDRDRSADSLLSDSGSSSDISPRATHLTRKASPIAEEDENELFPLPSPRRSPTGSRSSSAGSSPRNSPRTSPGVSPKPSPGTSPNGSSSCLHPNSAVALSIILKQKSRTSSKESVSSEEVLASNGTAGISRKASASDVTTPPQSGASTPRAAKPRPLSLTLAFPSTFTTRKSSVNSEMVTPSSNDCEGSSDTVPNSPISPSADVPLSSSFTSSISSTSSTNSALESKSPITPTSPRSPIPSSPNTTGKMTRKLSFGLPFLKAGEAIRGAGADVLKGVSSMSGGGGSMHISGV